MSKSHGPAFIAGVVAGGLTVAVAQEREAEWRRWADWAEERIAELEAELAMERGAIKNRDEALSQSNAWWGVEYRAMKARAEKAEAEVERLSLLAKKATPRTEERDEG